MAMRLLNTASADSRRGLVGMLVSVGAAAPRGIAWNAEAGYVEQR
jgi:hypothetical protein